MPPTPNAIVQMFDWPFRRVEEELLQLANLGYSHVLVSPPQKSNPATEWWGRYQPVDFTVLEGPLGDAEDLRSLCRTARNLDVAIVVDAVLNHMANHPDYLVVEDGQVRKLAFPRYSERDFHPPGCRGDICGWLGGLPDLKTESRHVRDEARDYVTRLVNDIGVNGFRFDAAKHIEADFYAYLLSKTPGLFCFGEFVVNHPDAIGQDYLALMDAYDFPLAATMKRAFGWGGDLRSLTCPARSGNALTGVSAVTFVRHHDIVQHPDWFADFYLASDVDRALAYAYILVRREGTPFVFLDDRRLDLVRAGLAFRREASGKEESWLVAEPNQLVLQRGRDQLAIINKAGEPFRYRQSTQMPDGRYRDLTNNAPITVSQGVIEVTAAPSSAVFLVPERETQPQPRAAG